MTSELKRTLLFVPGNRKDRMIKALASDADGVILDLEDSVPPAEKEGARGLVEEVVRKERPDRPGTYVRVNGLDTEFMQEDVRAAVWGSLAGIVLPKVERPDDIASVDELLASAEKKAGIPEGSLEAIPIIETALGVENIYQIACAKARNRRLRTVAFGAADYTLDLGISMTRDGTELLYPRSRIVVASRAARIEPPIDSPWMIDLKDREGLIRDASCARQLGFQGKLVIHPNQIEPVNRIFSPTPEEIEYARKVTEAFEEAERAGSGAITVDGRFVDYPIVERSRRILALSEMIAGR